MAGYSKEFLIDAFVFRYLSILDEDGKRDMTNMASNFFDEVGKDDFRKYCSLDADAIKAFKAAVS
jgi:hypothetical protein